MTIRPAAPEDVEQIVDVWFDSARHHSALDPERYHVPDRESILERYRTGSQYPEGISARTTLVAETEMGVVGFVDAWIDTPFDPMLRPMRYCFIAGLAVAESRRGHGIRERLMRDAEEWAKAQDARYVVLAAEVNNPRAIAFYQRAGYRPAATTLLRWI